LLWSKLLQLNAYDNEIGFNRRGQSLKKNPILWSECHKYEAQDDGYLSLRQYSIAFDSLDAKGNEVGHASLRDIVGRPPVLKPLIE
jgi:hypothetical protein